VLLLLLLVVPGPEVPLPWLLELLVSGSDDGDGVLAGVLPPPMVVPVPASAGASPDGCRPVAGGVEVGSWAGGAGAWRALPPVLPFFDDLGLGFGRAFGLGFAAGFTAGEEERGALVVGVVTPEPDPWEAEADVVGDAVCVGVWTAAETVVGGV
jgi:hypothetical protein